MRHYLFHITPLEHLPAILTSGTLHCAQNLLNITPELQWWTPAHIKRRQQPVPCVPHGTLLDYVPFYFFTHPPQLHRTPQREATQWAYLITDVATLRQADRRFFFTDGDPLLMGLTQFYPSAHPFDVLNWTLHQHDQWRHTPDDLDLDRRRSATLMVQHSVPFSLILGVAVSDPQTDLAVRKDMREYNKKQDVIIRPHWF